MRETHAPSPIVIVVAAIVVRDGRVLLTRRVAGAHLELHWEFPGGKVEPGEDPPGALGRELAEELGVVATIEAPFAFNYHAYPDRRVLLLTYRVSMRGEPRPIGCSDLGWFDAAEVARLLMPPADAPIIDRLAPLLAPARPRP